MKLFRTFALSTALGLTLPPAFAEVTLRDLAGQGGLSANELAADLGYFDGTGITLESVGYTQGYSASLVALPGGSVVIGSAATAAVLNSIAAFTSNGINDEAKSIFCVLEDSPIKSIEDIVGKTIAVNTLGAHLDYVVREALHQKGLPGDSANLIVVPGLHCRTAGSGPSSTTPTSWATSQAGSSCCAATGSRRSPRSRRPLSKARSRRSTIRV